MRFGRTLRMSINPKWKDEYIDYGKLKSMLREDVEDETKWTEDDENKFCDEIFNVQLEKVAKFQAETFQSLEARANKAADQLKEMSPDADAPKGEISNARFKEIEEELDAIINETKELKKFSNINYTGFLKIVKKHDRKRGNNYKIRPMLMLSMSKRPFNSEQSYTPLLNKLSLMFFAVGQQLDKGDAAPTVSVDEQSETHNGERYTAYKFWVHSDNLLELKTYILRRLPVLVYSEQAANNLESQSDPILSSLYFDNPAFSLYNEKVESQVDASSLRIRWYGQLNTQPELVIEQKIIHGNGTSEERRFPVKEKYIQPFIKGEYHMEKSIQKMERQGLPADQIEAFKTTVSDIQKFILDNDLQPVLRAVYTRTAFQKPLDDKVRISIDTSLAFIREDAIDHVRPCRNPDNWHRTDIDNSAMVYPFPNINQGEVSRFPFAVLEIKVKEDGAKKTPQWVEDLMASHLVHKAPRFSKFVHGVASLFEDNVNNLPFWLSEVETDIRKDPQAAFDAEETRKAKHAENELVVGSLLGTSKATPRKGSSFKGVNSPLAKSYMQERMAAEEAVDRRGNRDSTPQGARSGSNGTEGPSSKRGYGTMASLVSSISRYSQVRRERNTPLPPGVTKPTHLLKDAGPVEVEAKVWFANERTYLKWQHISILLGSLSIGLYTASGRDTIGMVFGFAYLAIALFAAIWGWAMHRVRSGMIEARSGKDFDNMIGPLVITFALIVALVMNLIFQYNSAIERMENANYTKLWSDINGELRI